MSMVKVQCDPTNFTLVTGTIREAMETINRSDNQFTLVVDSKAKFAGILTDGDIRRALLSGRSLDTPVTQVMKKDGITVRVGTPLEDLLKHFNSRIRFVPILNADHTIESVAKYDIRVHIPIAEPSISDLEVSYVMDCLKSGWISSTGKYIGLFEEEFARFCGVENAIACSNGTTALHLALLGADVGPGDEVIVPNLSFVATANSVLYCGATPVFVDVDPQTWNMDLKAFERAITPKTKAVMPVHLYGFPAEMPEINTIARKAGIAVIEDAAEAHGAAIGDKKIGSFGDFACFSFFGNKIITTGEGGMILVKDPKKAEKLRILRDHGMSRERRYFHPVMGFNYRMTNVQAAIGLAQLQKVDAILEQKFAIAATYTKILSEARGITLPPKRKDYLNVHWMYCILVEDDYPLTQVELMQKLKTQEIESRPFFLPMQEMPYLNGSAGDRFEYPVTKRLSERGINLPSSPNLTLKEVEKVATLIRDWSNG